MAFLLLAAAAPRTAQGAFAHAVRHRAWSCPPRRPRHLHPQPCRSRGCRWQPVPMAGLRRGQTDGPRASPRHGPAAAAPRRTRPALAYGRGQPWPPPPATRSAPRLPRARWRPPRAARLDRRVTYAAPVGASRCWLALAGGGVLRLVERHRRPSSPGTSALWHTRRQHPPAHRERRCGSLRCEAAALGASRTLANAPGFRAPAHLAHPPASLRSASGWRHRKMVTGNAFVPEGFYAFLPLLAPSVPGHCSPGALQRAVRKLASRPAVAVS